MDMGIGVWPGWRQGLESRGESVAARLVRHSGPQALWNFYTQHGYLVRTAGQARTVPHVLQEYRVSLLRRRYRSWIVGEMALASLAGPASPLPGTVLLGMILLQWGIAVGWSYGLDMTSEHRQTALVSMVEKEMAAAIFGTQRNASECLLGVVRLGLMGWGQELVWADRIMAHVRSAYRQEAQIL